MGSRFIYTVSYNTGSEILGLVKVTRGLQSSKFEG